MASEHQSVESDILEGSGVSVSDMKENPLILKPVPDNASGEGLPYAPVDWPNLGDIWTWKVGKRKNSSGFMADRYLYAPRRLQNSSGKRLYFASLPSIKEFVRKEFPDTSLDDFFASFSWKIPAKYHWGKKVLSSREVMAEHSGSELHTGMKCKARNKMCPLQLESRNNSPPFMNCDICCNEPGFCRDCCCILCSRSIDWAYGGYSFIRCEAIVNEDAICGHAAHIDCALRCYLAGKVGGSIRLDVEYCCRRCDKRTDLISHVTKLLQTCESLDSRECIEKILKMGLCIVRGSQRENAMKLLKRIELVLTKLISGFHLRDIWNMEDNTFAVSSGAMLHHGNNGNVTGLVHSNGQFPHKPDNIETICQQPNVVSDHQIEALKLEAEIEQVLQNLKRSQELEYRMAQQRLTAQKDFLISTYEHLDADKAKLAKRTGSTSDFDVDALLTKVLSRVKQIKEETVKFKEMEEVAKGFGKTPPSILKEHFGFYADD